MTQKNSKLINFAAGPAALPAEVMAQASEAILDYNNSGLSILEIGHRSALFNAILEESKALVIELCELSDDYEVLWMQGGGRLQFAMIPMNFLGEEETAGYIDSGYWANDAMQQAKYYGNTLIITSSGQYNYQVLPEWPAGVPAELTYVHFTTNNTIEGTQLKGLPVCPVPLIADMSSDILSCRRMYDNCAMFYAVAQKNLGIAGNTLVVMRKDLLQQTRRNLPPMLDYAQHVQAGSVLNTAPVFGIYVSLLMLRWIKKQGIEHIEVYNRQKAELLYHEIERNSLFYPLVQGADRSRMNIVFRPYDVNYEKGLISFCRQHHITGIEGHRRMGGFRVSLYNALQLQDVQYLVAALQDFEKQQCSS